MYTRNTAISFCGVVALGLAVAGCDSAVSPHQVANGANRSRADAHAYDAWTLAVSIESTPGTSKLFNTSATEGCPNISRDGKSFYFASNRPTSLGLDIWVSTRDKESDGWGDPVRLDAPVNAPAMAAGAQINDFCPTITRDDHLFFFASNRPYADAYGNAPCGGDDLYMTRRRDDGTFEEPRNLGCDVNSSANEAGPFLIEEPGRGKVLYFSSFRSPGVFPNQDPNPDSDVYSSEWQGGTFAPALPVPGVNSPKDDGQPNLRRDALEMYFFSSRVGIEGTTGTYGFADIFVATRASTNDPWETPLNLGQNVNTREGMETRPSLSWDGNTLYFGSTAPALRRPQAEGMSDIYMTTRARKLGRPE